MAWTDERISLLTKWWREGFSISRIAVLLGGVSRNGVISKVHRLGLPERGRNGRNAYHNPRPRNPKTNPNSGSSLRPETEAASAKSPVRPASPRPREGMPEGTVEAVRALPTMGVCRYPYPIGDPKLEEFRFCGDVVEPGGVYCAGHNGTCYQRGSSLDGSPKRQGKTPVYPDNSMMARQFS